MSVVHQAIIFCCLSIASSHQTKVCLEDAPVASTVHGMNSTQNGFDFSLLPMTSHINLDPTVSLLTTHNFHTLVPQLVQCKTERMIFIRDGHSPLYADMYATFLKGLVSLSMPILNIKVRRNASIRDDVTNIILRNEMEDGVNRRLITSYILFSSRASDILEDVEKTYTERFRHAGFLFPHRSKWLIFVSTHVQALGISQQQKNSILDNVVSVSYYSRNATNLKPRLPDVVAFMWRENRTREPQMLTPKEMIDSKKCALFPNVRFGLNQKKLTAITKMNFDVSRKFDNATGSYVYTGFAIRVLDHLSASLNFTYDLYPPADDQPVNISTKDIFEAVGKQEYDIGAGMWRYQRGRHFNVSHSYPSVFDAYVGLYKLHKNKKDMASLIVYPFKPTTFAMIGGSILYCNCFYMAIRLVLCTRHIDEDVGHKPEIDQSNPDTESPEDRLVSPNRQLNQSLTLITSILQSFIWGQYFPRPILMSSRIILCLMSLSTVIYYALYTGVLTATITSLPNRAQDETWDHFLTNDGYKCRVLVDSYNRNLLSGHLMKNRYKTVNKYCTTDFSLTTNKSLEAILHRLDEKTILIFYRSEFQRSLLLKKHPEKFVFVSEVLINLNRALIFPQSSEIERLVSSSWLNYASSSLNLDHCGERFLPTHKDRHNKKHNSARNHPDNKNRIVLEDVTWLFVLIASLTLCSTVVLAIEWIVVCFRRRSSPGDVPERDWEKTAGGDIGHQPTTSHISRPGWI